MHPYDFPPSKVTEPETEVSIEEISAHCRTYKGGDARSAIFQLVTTLALLAATCTLMFYSLDVSYWITAALVLPASGLLVRVFIFQHDCGHASFFKSKAANMWVGRALSMLTFTPYDAWRRAHNMHHATSGNLDKRSTGAVDTITVEEYKALSKRMQLAYRIYRHPLFLIVLGSPLYIIIAQRFPFNQGTKFFEDYKSIPASSLRSSIMLTNVALVVCFGALGAVVGFGALLAVYLPVLALTSCLGGWLFYVQHQFEDTSWERQEDWNVLEAGLMGSSYYEMPKILQWFTGNIGLHHIHHLCAGIPNYKLQACMDARPELAEINKLTLRESLKCTHLKLWDEARREMVPLRAVEG